MVRFVFRRLLQAVPLLLLISLIVFSLIHAAPGGPLTIFLSNPNVRPQDLERLRHALGLDRPVWAQYLAWLTAFVQGDWGYSYADGRPVLQRIAERLPATFQLAATALGLAGLTALPTGVMAATRRRGWFDRITTSVALAGISLPVFWFGLVLQLAFAVSLGWLPSAGQVSYGGGDVLDRVRHLILPATVLAFAQAAAWSRYLRASLIDVLHRLYIVAARARGVPPARVLMKHALRNALIAFTTVALLDAGLLVSGAVVTESVFAWPGVGSLFTEALSRRDYTVLMAFLMMSSVAIVLLNLLADVCYRVLDPRITQE